MFLYSLLALAVVTALIFAAPLKAKVWATLARWTLFRRCSR